MSSVLIYKSIKNFLPSEIYTPFSKDTRRSLKNCSSKLNVVESLPRSTKDKQTFFCFRSLRFGILLASSFLLLARYSALAEKLLK